MSTNENKVRKLQRKSRDLGRKAKEAIKNSKAKRKIETKAKEASKWTSEAYEKSNAERILKPTTHVAKATIETSKTIARKTDKTIGASRKTKSVIEKANQHVTRPLLNKAEKYGISDTIKTFSDKGTFSFVAECLNCIRNSIFFSLVEKGTGDMLIGFFDD